MTDQSVSLVLFDLDGTLLDTAEDLGGALNALLFEEGHPPLPMHIIRPHVSKGGMALVVLGFELDPKSDQALSLWKRLLDHYETHVCVHTRFFPGIEEVLNRIENNGQTWGIVTNKPAYLTHPLLDALDLTKRAACVVSGDTLARKKPHPDPILHALKLTNTRAQNAIYIGDDLRDIEAGNAAGLRTIAACYGYIVDGDDPIQWNADGLINHPNELDEWIN